MSRLDRVVAIAAIVTAAAAVFIAAYEARITRQNRDISVWPYVRHYNTYRGGVFTRNLLNGGLGPGIAGYTTVRVDDDPVSSWDEVVARITGEADADFGQSTVRRGDILLPGEDVELIQVLPGPLAQALYENRDRIGTTVCYCSVFGKCWVSDSHQPQAREVRSCE